MTERNKDATASRFAANIRARREFRDLSQAALAQTMVDLGHRTFKQQTIAEIENGGRQVKLEEALALSRALGISMDSLVRPAGLTKQASELLDAARETRETARQAAHWLGEFTDARRRLERAIGKAAGDEAALGDELSVARRALAETEHE